MNLFAKKKQPESRRPRQRDSLKPTAKIPPTISYSDSTRQIRSSGVASQARDRNMRQIETINEADTPEMKRWLVLIALVIILFAVVFELGLSTTANIDIVQPSGFKYLPHSLAQYKSAASVAISSSVFNRFKTTISSNDIATILEQRYPEIAYAAVTVPLIGLNPTVHIQLARPVLIYSVDNAGSYLVSSSGFIVAAATSVPKAELKSLPDVYAVNSVPNGDRVQVLTSDSVTFIETVQQALALKGMSIARMNLVPMAEELDVYPLGTAYYIKFNLNQTDALSQVGTYLATIANLKQQNKLPTQYIDVRLDGRAYYK